jgi:hypothetical protein
LSRKGLEQQETGVANRPALGILRSENPRVLFSLQPDLERKTGIPEKWSYGA